jgi:hypothetical protein
MHQLNLLNFGNTSTNKQMQLPRSTKNTTAKSIIFKETTYNKRKDSILKSGKLSPSTEFKSEINTKNKFTQFTQKSNTVNIEQFKKMKIDSKPTNLRNINTGQASQQTGQSLKQEFSSPIKTNNSSLFNSYNNNLKLASILQQAQNSAQSNLKYILTNNSRKNPQKTRSPRNKGVSLSLLPKFSEKETNLKTETSTNTNKSGSVILTKSLEQMNTTHMNSMSVNIALTEPNLDPRDVMIEKLNSKIHDLEGKLRDLQDKVSQKPGNILITGTCYDNQVLKTENFHKIENFDEKIISKENFKNQNEEVSSNCNFSTDNFYDTQMITSPGSKKNRIINISKIETIRSKLYKPDTDSTQSAQNDQKTRLNMSNVNKNVGLFVNTSNLSQSPCQSQSLSVKKDKLFNNYSNKRNLNNSNFNKLGLTNPSSLNNYTNQLSPNREVTTMHFHTKPCSFKNSLEISEDKESYTTNNNQCSSVKKDKFLERQNFKSVNISPRKIDRKNFLFNEALNISQERERKREESIYIEEDNSEKCEGEVSYILSNKFYKEQLNSIKVKTQNLLNKFSKENSRLLGIGTKDMKSDLNIQNVQNMGNNSYNNSVYNFQKYKSSQPHSHIHSKSYLL